MCIRILLKRDWFTEQKITATAVQLIMRMKKDYWMI